MITVGLIGVGYWGTNLCRALVQNERVNLAWICDDDAGALARSSGRAPRARVTGEMNRLLEDASVDAIVVATPANTHAALGMRVLAAGKHLLVEKPLAMSSHDGEQLCKEAKAGGLILMVGHTYLYNPAVRRIKALIDGGELGDVRYATCQRLNLGIVRRDVDVLWNLAPHDLSMLDYWFATPVVSVASVGHAYLQAGIADVAFAHLWYEGGMSGHVQVSWLDPAKARRATVVGSRRMLIFDDMSADARLTLFDKGVDSDEDVESIGRYASYGEHRFLVRAGDAWIPRLDSGEPLALELDAFVDSVETGTPPLADGNNGLTVVQTLERLTDAMVIVPPGEAGI